MTNQVQIGVGLWSMRASVANSASWRELYADLMVDARLAEELGFDTLWVAEHHFWYDGWCPQPLTAAAAALGASTRLRVGTAMHLLPQHDPGQVVDELRTMRRLHGDRLDFGVGLGYRDEEYDGVGAPRSERGRRMSHHLDDVLAATDRSVPVYVGGMADAAIRRAGQRGLGLLLPNTLKDDEVVRRIDMAASEAQANQRVPGRVGMLIDAWVLDDEEDDHAVRDQLARHYREYTGAWYLVEGQPMHNRPELLDRQSSRTKAAAVVGDAAQVLDGLLRLTSIGVDTFVLQVRGDRTPADYRRTMRVLARDVLPTLRDAKVRDVA